MNEKIESMDKKELLKRVHAERRALEKQISRVSPAGMLLPGVAGDWSVKDILAHISAWERSMISWVGSHLRGETPQVPQPWDVEKINADFHEQIKDKLLPEVLLEFRRSHEDALALAERLTEEQLQTKYTDTWPMGPLWLGVAANMVFHYREHAEDIEKWLASRKKTPVNPTSAS